ncbi:hypothetical protein [Algibacter sp. 2305UL17-15]|uniref:hypothetical protein n=1 Tax=Algibacter sp. 2305UL17-15 TaxID=3231268 RepID=UPI00345831AA
MRDLKGIISDLYSFSKKHELKEITNINNGSNLQMIFSNNNVQIEFLRDKGEFSTYINFLKIPTKRDLYSLNIIAEILSNENIRDTNHLNQLNYLQEYWSSIFDLFKNDVKVDEKYDVIFNKLFDW